MIMKKILTSLVLIIVAVVASYYTAIYFGKTYEYLFGEGSAWIGSARSWQFIIGFPLSLIFFLTLVAHTWVFKSKASTLWFISPLLLWEGVVDVRHIYIPIILGLIAWGLSTLVKKVFKITT